MPRKVSEILAPEYATGNRQSATHYLDAGSYLLVLKGFDLK
jgi:hypothetical protein